MDTVIPSRNFLWLTLGVIGFGKGKLENLKENSITSGSTLFFSIKLLYDLIEDSFLYFLFGPDIHV